MHPSFLLQGGNMTPTDICNMALSLINGGRIYGLDEETETARQCRLHYDATRQMLLSQYEWNFARKREECVLSEHKLAGYEFVYAYPEKCIRILGVIPKGERFKAESQKEYDVFTIDDNTKYIVSDVPLAYIDYVYDVQDIDVFSPVFVQALKSKMGAELAMPLTGNSGLFDQCYKLYQAATQEAKSLSAKERRQDMPYISNYVKARSW